MTKFASFKKLMAMLVFPEDLNKKCQVLEKWQPFSFFISFLIYYRNYFNVLQQKNEITSLSNKV